MLIFSLFNIKLFYPIYTSKEIIITYAVHPFNIVTTNPELWAFIKKTYIFVFIFSNITISNYIYNRFILKFFKTTSNITKEKNLNHSSITKDNLKILVGLDEKTNSKTYVTESGLYQNFLITGTIGSGKTSSAMYPFTKQLMKFNYDNPNNKIGMLILDVKGNYHKQVKIFSEKYNLEKDLITIALNSGIYYNPLHKPNLKPQVLADRLKTILLLFSENNSESYWIDKASQVICESIKLCRLYNNGYVTFLELHKLITIPTYFNEKITILRNLFISSKLNQKQIYELNECLEFFQKEFNQLDSRTKGILISEITRITSTFITDYDVMNTFCPPKNKLNFKSFNDVIKKGKIVVLNMNISEYSQLSKIIATYLKLDFQTEIMSNLSKNTIKTTAFICDEYDKYASKTDSDFFSLSREAKCINIISTQSYSSLKLTLKDDYQVRVLIQNLINKIWFRTDDSFTIEEAQKQLGKEEKKHTSKSISESAKETNFNYITNSLNSKNSNISETFSTYTQKDFMFDSSFFSQELETFTALTFLSNGYSILKPQKIKLLPYFKK